MRRHMIWLVLGVAGAVVLLVAYRHEANARAEQERQAQEIDRLEKKMSRLQGQVAVVGTAAVLGARPPRSDEVARDVAPPMPAAVPAPVAPPSGDQEPAPPRLHTAAEQAEVFKGYFASIDQLRGAADDPALTGRLSEALRSVKPEFASLQKGHLDLLRCGNGICRIEMSFPSEAEMSHAKTELLFQIGPLAGPSTMYADPGGSRLFAYFAAPGAKLPPFPKGPA